MKTNNPETLSTLGTQDRGRKQTTQRHCEHWAHKIQHENQQSRDTVNTGQCLWIVCFLPVSCVPSVDSVSELFVFFLYLVCPMLTVSLDCLFPSCILCVQCSQCLWIVSFQPVSCVPSVHSVSGLFVFVLYLVCPVLTVSLDCLFPSCILCVQCSQCLWIVCFQPVSCVPSVDSVSGLFVFYLYLVFPVLTVSLVVCFLTVYLVPSVQRHCQHWAHKIQEENKQSRDTVNTGHTR
jgi:hypothetical protein